MDFVVDENGSPTYVGDRSTDISVTVNEDLGNGLWKYVATRPVDTGDEGFDYVVPTDSEWTMGWAICSTDNDLATQYDQSGTLKWNFGDSGATYLAGLTLTSAVAMALIVSQ